MFESKAANTALSIFMALAVFSMGIAARALYNNWKSETPETPVSASSNIPIQYEKAQSQTVNLNPGEKMVDYSWDGKGLKIKMRDMVDDDIAETTVITNKQSGDVVIVKEAKK